MPNAYAHYRFATAQLALLPPDARLTVKRFRRLYDVGAHGPDMFFFSLPGTGDYRAAERFHHQTGQEFFGRVCRRLRLEPNEAATAYLYGILTHYALDSTCHPFVTATERAGTARHMEIEAEFDRFLYALDGRSTAAQRDMSAHMLLTRGEAETAAAFFPGRTSAQLSRDLRMMAQANRLIVMPEGFARRAAARLLGRFADSLLIPYEPMEKCVALDAPMLALYNEAFEKFPRLLARVQSAIARGTELGELFIPDFG
ncbi:MAG: zinc dependent phospholipase C family protein [Firmicutes bacterium]|nr:zinc dependent phospholipase C family protein [Bacillota bacterium]